MNIFCWSTVCELIFYFKFCFLQIQHFFSVQCLGVFSIKNSFQFSSNFEYFNSKTVREVCMFIFIYFMKTNYKTRYCEECLKVFYIINVLFLNALNTMLLKIILKIKNLDKLDMLDNNMRVDSKRKLQI